MMYAQEKGGQKLHLVFEAEDSVSQPICGRKVNGYRMTVNAPLAHACMNCQRVYQQNGGAKIKNAFFSYIGGTHE
jgi:hypothetical protein